MRGTMEEYYIKQLKNSISRFRGIAFDINKLVVKLETQTLSVSKQVNFAQQLSNDLGEDIDDMEWTLEKVYNKLKELGELRI